MTQSLTTPPRIVRSNIVRDVLEPPFQFNLLATTFRCDSTNPQWFVRERGLVRHEQTPQKRGVRTSGKTRSEKEFLSSKETGSRKGMDQETGDEGVHARNLDPTKTRQHEHPPKH